MENATASGLGIEFRTQVLDITVVPPMARVGHDSPRPASHRLVTICSQEIPARNPRETLLVIMPVPSTIGSRHLTVKHTTRFAYSQPIQHSRHCVHLRPINDVHQNVLNYRLQIVPAVPIAEFEDVFGNSASRFEISQPYTELTLTAESTIALSGADPFAFTRGESVRRFPWCGCRGST